MRIFAVMAVLAIAAFSSQATAAAKESVIYAFLGGSDGASPQSALIADSTGNLYGTAKAGGALIGCPGGCGVIFKLSPSAKANGSWTETAIYTFKGGADGQSPVGGLIFDSAGALYGTTAAGGKSTKCAAGCGTAFKLTPPSKKGARWTKTILSDFTGSAGGDSPLSDLKMDRDGALYGATGVYGASGGGVPPCICASVFKLTPPADGAKAWSNTTLYSYAAGDGSPLPVGGLFINNNGALFGTTPLGGSFHCFAFGCGAAFKLNPPAMGKTSWIATTLYSFSNSQLFGQSKDGVFPNADLVADSSGNLYGITNLGGGSGCFGEGCGTVYKLSVPTGSGKAWTEAILYSFKGGNDGAGPGAGRLALGPGSALFGTTPSGGSTANYGTVFELKPPSVAGGKWTETVLHVFTGGSDGSAPHSGLILARGVLYGTTSAGGLTGAGTVFKVKP